MNPICKKCNRPVFRDWEGFYCPSCGESFEPEPKPKTKRPEPVYEEPLHVQRPPARRLSPAESRRRYHNSSAGKASWLRYRRSTLFAEAHRRHRQTQKYADTQRRFHDKIKLFRILEEKLYILTHGCGHPMLEYLGMNGSDVMKFRCMVCGAEVLNGVE